MAPQDPSRIPYVLVALGQMERQQLVCAELRGSGVRVQQASNGAEAHVQLQSTLKAGEPLPLVFSDMSLPLRNGLLLLSDLRFAGVEAPFVLVTDDPAFQTAARTLGAIAVPEPVVDLENLTIIMELARTQAKELSNLLRERRRYGRFPVDVWVEKRDSYGVTFIRSSSLSQGGMALRQGSAEEVGEQYYLCFHLPGKWDPIEARSRVVNVRPVEQHFIVGMEFLDLEPTARQSIAELWANV